MLPISLLCLGLVLIGDASGRAISEEANWKVDDCWGLKVNLEVNSLVTTAVPRQLEVSWFNAQPQSEDIVGLFTQDPTRTRVAPIFQVPVNSESGVNLTSIEAPSTSSFDLGYTAQCLGYWLAYVRQGQVLASNCLKTLPTWMWDMKAELGQMQLRDMFVPGTHNSASYKKYPGGHEDIITKYTFTQEEDILGQLIYGIRYVDIRIGHYKNQEDPWWTFHGHRTHPLREVIQQFKLFIDNTNEIVIMDIQEFQGFGDGLEIHQMLVEFLEEQLIGYYTLPSLTWEVTLDGVWNSGKRLIVTYDDERISAGHPFLWRAVQHRWGNVQTLDALYNYLAGAIITPPANRPHALMAELTATALGTITDELGGLRNMADTVNRNVSLWFRGSWGETVNVVAADFFRGTAIIEEAVEWNLRRAAHESCSNTSRPSGRARAHYRHVLE